MTIPISPLPYLIRCLWQHFSRRRQTQFVVLFGLMLVCAFAEVVSLGAVLPFIGILTAPDAILRRPLVADIAQTVGITSADGLVLPITVAFASAALFAGAIRILFLWASTRIAFASGADLSFEVYRRTLYQPYHVHVGRNSSHVISSITRKIDNVVSYVLMSCLTLISSIILFLSILFVLLAIDWVVALVAIASFGVSYGLIAWTSRRRLQLSSQRIAYEQTQVVKALQEGLGGIRDVLLDGTQSYYCDIYRQADRPLRREQSYIQFNGGSPRPAMEAAGTVLIAVLAYSLSRHAGGIGAALPVLAALALGAQRLLPALQQSYAAWANILGSQASLAETIELLDQPLPSGLMLRAPAPIPFNRDICFDGVKFRYTKHGPFVLNGINMTIPKGARVGLIGATGSGKSTLIDIAMGLLQPTHGVVLIDGEAISSSNSRAWQTRIAHVPQAIFLADTTIEENIAFGVPKDKIDRDHVRRSAQKAQIAESIESWTWQYQSLVGERGIRLSGGERQRIGIARALYKNADVIVFDEATSALDNETESAVMQTIENLGSDLTILIVAHRLTTLKNCTQIVELSRGRMKRIGSYSEIVGQSILRPIVF